MDNHTEGEAEEGHDLSACRGGEDGNEPPVPDSSPVGVSAGRRAAAAAVVVAADAVAAAAAAVEAGEEGQLGAEDVTWAATKRARMKARLVGLVEG